jgi:hypothetical protein
MRQAVWSRLVAFAVFAMLIIPSVAKSDEPLKGEVVVRAAPQGFGDRDNSWAWAMQWWRGHLYVGTNRAWECATAAALHALDPRYQYPPTDPDIACTDDSRDLPMQAEIWRWSPPNRWERVYQAPAIPIPGESDKVVGRDVGYRGMTIFTERDGTEALYVGGVSARFMGYDVPAPRILRSVDGEHFEAVPQDPGTTLADLPYNSLRNPVTYKGRLYFVAGDVLGAGALLEAGNPQKGNNHFRVVSPRDMLVSAVQVFNDLLYVGTRDVHNGFGVYKTDALGTYPYRYQPLIEKGGYVPQLPDNEVLHMRVFNDCLYIGTDATGDFLSPSTSAELLRLHSDDSWDVVVGDGRMTPEGLKTSLSGYSAGFGNAYTRHMWRMETFDGALYVGTFDSSTLYRNEPGFPQSMIGADLYRSFDGVHFEPLTTTGFGDPFNFGIRTMSATPYGLFIGTANYYYGLNIYRMKPPGFQGWKSYLPVVAGASIP